MAVQRYMIDFSALYAKLQKYFLIARNVSYKDFSNKMAPTDP